MAAPLLSVRDLAIAFGETQAVDGLSFDVPAGETVALVGESGSGKSASALAIMRLVEREGGRITRGSLSMGGPAPIDLATLDERAMRRVRGNRIAMVFQEPMTALNPVMPLGHQVAEVLRLHQGLDAARARAAARDALDRVRIPDAARRLDQYPHELSGGLRQRVMIAIALACRPELLIADEPTTALDVTTQAEILALIRTLQAELGMSVLFITHDMGVVADIAERVVVLRRGRMEEAGRVTDVFAAPRSDYGRMLLAAAPRLGAGAPPPLERRGEPVIEARDLVVRYPVRRGFMPGSARDHHAVNGVSLCVHRGETLGLVGESGCGKSTVARALLRLVEPASGSIRLLGEDVTRLAGAALRDRRRHAQMVFQDPFASLNPRLPIVDLVTEPADIHGSLTGDERRDLARTLLERVGLDANAIDRYPHQFSGGQRQRICIARALSVRPALIVADEPVSALDVSVARQVTDLVARLQAEEGLAFLFISHDLAVVERVSHRVAVMYAGQIVETGPTADVLHDPRHPYTRRLLAAVPVPDPRRRAAGAVLPEAPAAPVLVRHPHDAPPRSRLVEVGPGHFIAEEPKRTFERTRTRRAPASRAAAASL
ncbi:dipeptide ABC transporter ATP-binding protein [Salinarimonas sp.]|uniref:ABC transporter ATP-binding protein n=1 Tax=Salinarimonas sp. TaxID=2766526 RepID=UPI00391D2BD8